MRHLSEMTRNSGRLVLLVLPAWLATGCEDRSIRLGGWAPPAPEPTRAPPAPAAPPLGEPPFPGGPPVPEGQLSVHTILKAHCTECHVYGLRDPAGWGSVLDLSRMIDSQIVVPGDLTSSRLWYRVAVRNDMPFNGTRLTPEEKGIIQAWILGLQWPVQRPRTQAEVLDLLVEDQGAAGNDSDTRYVSFADLVDARRTPEEIRAAAAVFKVILNSVSRSASIIDPVAVDPEGSIWRFRLRDLGWTEMEWNRLIAYYPYCLSSDAAGHQNLYQRLRTETPIVRGDWFVTSVLQPPLYHHVLQLGGTLDEIVRLNLGVDINQNIAQGKVQRIAANNSGVWSGVVLERHETRDGGYLWLSYQLAEGEDVRRTPLGPRNRHNRFSSSFSSTTTQALWSLPNGLQGYLLADADGNRLDTAPLELATGPRGRHGGRPENARACNVCHGASGLTLPREIVDIQRELDQQGMSRPAAEIAEIRRLYPASAPQTLAADAARYRETIRGLLADRQPAASSIEWTDFITLRGQYESSLGLRQGALELGRDLATAQREIQSSPSRRAPFPLLVTDPLVRRDEWMCQFRRIARDVRGATFCADTFTVPELRSFCDRLDTETGP